MIAIWLAIKVFGGKALDFFKSPWGQRLLVVLVTFVCAYILYAVGHSRGVGQEQRAEAARLEHAQKVVAKREAASDVITAKVGGDLTKAKVEIRYRTVTLVKEIPTYVTPADDSRCVIPVGFLRLYDRAVDPGLPEVPSGPQSAASGVTLSAVLDTDIENLGVAHEALKEAQAWRDWYKDQSAAWGK